MQKKSIFVVAFDWRREFPQRGCGPPTLGAYSEQYPVVYIRVVQVDHMAGRRLVSALDVQPPREARPGGPEPPSPMTSQARGAPPKAAWAEPLGAYRI
jgi:hypothetical protein